MKNILALPLIAAAGFMAAGFAVTNSAFALDEEITITGKGTPPVLHHDTGKRSSTTGAPIEEVTTSRVVYAGDLDLSTNHDMRTLDRRITAAARTGCQQLANMFPQLAYPGDSEKDRQCMKQARFEAYDQMRSYQLPSPPL